MDASTEGLTTLLDREEIRDCIARLARGEDRRDAGLVGGSFWSDARIDLGIFAGSIDEYLAWVVPGSPAIPVTQHVLGQSLIELDGDTALVETHVSAYHRVSGEQSDRDTVIGGRYLDRLDKRGSQWRIGQRTMLYDWYHDFGRSADWAQGLMGLQFSAVHYPGRADGDYSETFFGKGSKWAR
jgi:hypothetical protein